MSANVVNSSLGVLSTIQKSEKNSWVGESSPNSDHFFGGEIICFFLCVFELFLLLYMFQKKLDRGGGVGGVWPF